MKHFKEILKFFGGSVLGLVFTLVIGYTTFARAETIAIFDTVNRAFFIAQGAQNMVIGTAPSGTGTFQLQYKGTPIANVDSGGITYASGKTGKLTVNSVTFKATPTPGTDLLVSGYNIPAGTPTVSTIARLPATPTPGDVVEFYNSWTATLKVQAGGAATINGAGTNGTIAVATLVGVRCVATGTANWACTLGTNPTPAA